MQKQRKGILKVIFTMFLLACSIFSNLFTSVNNLAFALSGNAVEYTDVLTDLQKDENFNIEDYPIDNEDFSLKVIQIAESVNKELFIYVYQPSSDTKGLYAIDISLGLVHSDEPNFETNLYSLALLNQNGVFYKYKVNNFVVSNNNVRYYSITELHRNYNSSIDKGTDNDSTFVSIGIPIAQDWSAITKDGQVYYNCESSKIVTIVDRYDSFLRLQSTTGLGSKIDSFYVAFSTDYNIDDLYEAEVSFITRTYKQTTDNGLPGVPDSGDVGVMAVNDISPRSKTSYEYGDSINHDKVLKATNSIDVETGFWFRKKYSWNKIETTSRFIDSNRVNGLSDSAINHIQDKQYVLRYYESEYKRWTDSIGTYVVKEYETGDRVEEITILRLRFRVGDKVYNLGVVDNKVNVGSTPSNHYLTLWEKIGSLIKTFFSILWSWLKWVLVGIACIVSIPILIVMFPYIWFVLKYLGIGLWYCIKYLGIGMWYCIKYTGLGIWQGLKALWWFISYPFKIIKGQV